jgi:hypothetical protein
VITPVDHNDTITNVTAVIQQVEHHKTTRTRTQRYARIRRSAARSHHGWHAFRPTGLRRITNAEIRAKPGSGTTTYLLPAAREPER